MFKEKRKELLSRSPHNCAHSEDIRIHGNGKVVVCTLEENKSKSASGVFVCCQEVCGSCLLFQKRYCDKDVVAYCKGVMSDASRCGEENPKLAALLWVLDGEVFEKTSFMKRLFSFVSGRSK